jgi:uncharacterized protein
MRTGGTHGGYEIVRDDDGAFAFDIKSGRIFAIHDVLADLLEANPDDPAAMRRLTDLHDEDDLRRARAELERVRAVGLLPAAAPRDDSPGILKQSPYCQATILLTDRCNLRCRYCYDGYQGLREAEGGVAMDWPRLRWALDYVFRIVGAGSEIFDIHFFGGEPLLEFDLMRQAAEYCRGIARAHRVDVNLSVSTNGLLLTPEIIRFLADNQFDVSISLDGPPDAHNRARRFPNGTGSYEALEPKLDGILAAEDLYVELAGVLSPVNTDVTESFRWAYDKGAAAISFTIPKLRSTSSMAVKEGDLELIKASYTRLAQYLSERTAAEDFGPIASLIAANDYFGRFIKRVFAREHLTHRCRAGKDMLAIGADGCLYPCLGFVGMSDWCMGDIKRLPDEKIRDQFCQQHVDGKTKCRDCWGRYLCGGGCYAHAAMSNDRIDRPDPRDCDLTLHLMRLAILFVGRLQRQHPDILPRLFSALVRAIPAKHEKFVPPLLRQYMAQNTSAQPAADARCAHSFQREVASP